MGRCRKPLLAAALPLLQQLSRCPIRDPLRPCSGSDPHPSEVVPDITLNLVTPGSGKGALGTQRFLDGPRTLSRDKPSHEAGTNLESKLRAVGAYAGQRLSVTVGGKASGERLRSEPDLGNPVVRDRRGARGNVARRVGLRPTTKDVGTCHRTLKCARPGSIPTRELVWQGLVLVTPLYHARSGCLERREPGAACARETATRSRDAQDVTGAQLRSTSPRSPTDSAEDPIIEWPASARLLSQVRAHGGAERRLLPIAVDPLLPPTVWCKQAARLSGMVPLSMHSAPRWRAMVVPYAVARERARATGSALGV